MCPSLTPLHPAVAQIIEIKSKHKLRLTKDEKKYKTNHPEHLPDYVYQFGDITKSVLGLKKWNEGTTGTDETADAAEVKDETADAAEVKVCPSGTLIPLSPTSLKTLLVSSQDSAWWLKQLADQKSGGRTEALEKREQTLKFALEYFEETIPKFDRKKFDERIESTGKLRRLSITNRINERKTKTLDEITNDIILEVATILAVSGG